MFDAREPTRKKSTATHTQQTRNQQKLLDVENIFHRVWANTRIQPDISNRHGGLSVCASSVTLLCHHRDGLEEQMHWIDYGNMLVQL